MIGSKLGGYELEEEIGRGGMGVVYRASQPALGRQVAVKVLLPHLAQDAEFVERFLREARAAAKLEHPGLVTIFDVGEFEGTYYFSMQWLQGQTLEELLAEGGGLPLETAVGYAAQVAAALGFAHQGGVVHRDVKPANVILDHGGRAVLTDFGIAQAASETRLTRVGATVGSPDYMAPEQINGEQVDPRTDLYALGILFYHLLTGEPPYTGEAPIAVAYQHLNAPIPSVRDKRPEVPAELDAVVRRLMAKRREERFQSADELLAELVAFEPRTAELPLRPLTGGPSPPAADVRAGGEPVAPSRRPRLAAVMAVLAVGLAAAGGVYWMVGRGEAPAETPTVPVAPLPLEAPPPERFTATLELAPDLPGLAVWINGEDRGLEAPASVEVEGARGEPLLLELRRNGEVVARQELTLEPEMERRWAPQLAPAEELTISSEPPGASVTLDGEPLAEVTPLTLALVPGRRYEVALALDGHDAAGWSFELDELTAEQRESGRLHFPLVASVPPATLVVAAGYPVTVEAAGRRRSGSGEVRLELPPGTHEVRLAAPQVFYAATERVELGSDATHRIELPAAVAVTVAATPSFCRVQVDGRDIGYVPTEIELAIGPHDFRFDWENEAKTMTVTRQIGLATRRVFVAAPE